jgi:hypothetical protein
MAPGALAGPVAMPGLTVNGQAKITKVRPELGM